MHWHRASYSTSVLHLRSTAFTFHNLFLKKWTFQCYKKRIDWNLYKNPLVTIFRCNNGQNSEDNEKEKKHQFCERRATEPSITSRTRRHLLHYSPWLSSNECFHLNILKKLFYLWSDFRKASQVYQTRFSCKCNFGASKLQTAIFLPSNMGRFAGSRGFINSFWPAPH